MNNLQIITSSAVNILSILGSDTTIRALRYQAIEKKRFLFCGYMSPGIFNVGQMLLTTQSGLLAKSLSSKDEYTKISLPYLNPNTQNKYTGILSGTIAPIKTIYPEIFLSIDENISDIINVTNEEENNNFTIKIIKIFDINYDKFLDGSNKYISNLGLFAVVLNIIGAIYCFTIADFYISSLIIINILITYYLGFYFFLTKIKLAPKKVLSGSSAGDVLIELNRTFLLIKGDEIHIQSLLQMPMIINDNNYIGVTAGILCIILGVLNVIIIPLGSVIGQTVVALLLLIGYITNAFFATFDKETIYKRLINSCISIQYSKKIILPNRTSALSLIFDLYNFNAIINCKHLIPNSMTWKQWYNDLCTENENFKEPINETFIDGELLIGLRNSRNIGKNIAEIVKIEINENI